MRENESMEACIKDWKNGSYTNFLSPSLPFIIYYQLFSLVNNINFYEKNNTDIIQTFISNFNPVIYNKYNTSQVNVAYLRD